MRFASPLFTEDANITSAVQILPLPTIFKYTLRRCLHVLRTSHPYMSSDRAFVFPFIIEAGSGLSFVRIHVPSRPQNITVPQDWQVPFGPGTIVRLTASTIAIIPTLTVNLSSMRCAWSGLLSPSSGLTLNYILQFDKNGYTGGCQRQYTMIANTTVDDVTCANATFPLGPLEIDAQVENGPLGMYSWVNQVRYSKNSLSKTLSSFLFI